MISILIPARNEKYLQKTIEDILENATGDIEILLGMDGQQQVGFVDFKDDKRLKAHLETHPIGQRAITNKLVEKAQGDFIMKVDAHCSFGYGFDQKMLKDMQKDWVLSPYMMVLDGDEWAVKPEKKSSQYVFGTNMVMEYGQEKAGLLNETMCLQGSCWMVSKGNYLKWELGEEEMGSWGGQGVELGIKAFLGGGTCMTTKETYYAHVFRTTDADFPYERGETPGKQANDELIKRYRNETIRPLVEKFGYPLDWVDFYKS